MKIMHDYQVFFSQEYGGVSRYHIELIKELNRINDTPVSVSVLCTHNQYLSDLINKPKMVYSSNEALRKVQMKIERYTGILKSCYEVHQNDIVHLTWTSPYLNQLAKGKIIVTIHDMIHEIFWSEKPEYQNEIENKKKAIYESSAIIAISKNTKNDILRFYPDIPEKKITVVYHGTNHLPHAEKLKISLPDRYFLYVGRRDSYKGADFLINSIASILIENSELKLLFVGGGPFSEEENDTLKSLGLADSVIQMNVSDAELAFIYQHAICFIYPSLYEGFGFPILEAFDNDCPVICTKASSLPEVGGDAALYYENGDFGSLIELIKLMLNDDELRYNCIIKGRGRVKAFTWERSAYETYQVYKNVMEKMTIV